MMLISEISCHDFGSLTLIDFFYITVQEHFETNIV